MACALIGTNCIAIPSVRYGESQPVCNAATRNAVAARNLGENTTTFNTLCFRTSEVEKQMYMLNLIKHNDKLAASQETIQLTCTIVFTIQDKSIMTANDSNYLVFVLTNWVLVYVCTPLKCIF